MYALSLIQPDAISSLSLETAGDRAHAKELARRIYKYCLLAAIDSGHRARLIDALAGLPLDLQLLWIDIVKSNLLRRDDPGLLNMAWQGCAHGCENPNEPARRIQALVVAGEGAPIATCPTCGAETVQLVELLGSNSLATAERARSSALPANVLRDSIFEEKFSLILSAASSVTILDRYAGASLMRSASASGPAWFLGELAKRGINDVTLITGYGSTVNRHPTSASDITSAVRSAVGSVRSAHGGLGVFNLQVYRDNWMRDRAHDRFVRVAVNGNPVVVAIGKGVDVFRRQRLDQNYSFGWQEGDVVAQYLKASAAQPVTGAVI